MYTDQQKVSSAMLTTQYRFGYTGIQYEFNHTELALLDDLNKTRTQTSNTNNARTSNASNEVVIHTPSRNRRHPALPSIEHKSDDHGIVMFVSFRRDGNCSLCYIRIG